MRVGYHVKFNGMALLNDTWKDKTEFIAGIVKQIEGETVTIELYVSPWGPDGNRIITMSKSLLEIT